MKHHTSPNDGPFSINLVLKQKFNTELDYLIGKSPVPKSGFKSNENVGKIQVAKIKF
jgi:hypothetical protein